MNLKNTEQAARLFGGDLRLSAGGALTLTLVDRDQLVFPAPTIDTTSDEPELGSEAAEPRLRRYVERDPIGREVNRALWSLASVTETVHQIDNDPHLTDAGRADRRREPTRVGALNIADAHRQLNEIEVGIIERQAALEAVPRAVDSTDTLWDIEIVRRVLASEGPDRQRMLAQLARGENERITLALMRSQFPLGTEEDIARRAWRAAAERHNPEAFQQIAAETEHLQGARLIIKRAAEKFAAKARLSGYPLFEAAASDLTLPNGPAVFFSDPGELRQHRIRWQAMRQRAA
jgi:hypothetical protein